MANKVKDVDKMIANMVLENTGPVRKLLRETIKIQLNCLRSNTHLIDQPTVFTVPDQEPLTMKRKRQFNMYNKFGRKMFSSGISYSSYNFYTKGLAIKLFSSSVKSPIVDISTLDIAKHLDVSNSSEKEIIIDNTNTKFDMNENIIEFDQTTNWEEKVLNSPFPVVVDCYADWCGPCKKLMPIIKKKLDEMKNFRLVKINIDNNQELAEQLNISSIPAVFLIYKGNVVDQFVGLPAEPKINEFFKTISLLQGMGKNEEIFKGLLTGADEFMKKLQYDQAENMLSEAYSQENFRGKYGYLIKLGLSIVNYNKKNYSKSAGFIKDLFNFHKSELTKDPLASKKAYALELLCSLNSDSALLTQSEDELIKKIKENEGDLTIRFVFVNKLLLKEDYEYAVKELLQMIKIDKNWSDKKANKLLVSLFNILGSDSKIVIEGRKALAKIIY